MIRDIATEAQNVNELAKMTALNIIIKSFKVQKDSNMEDNQLAGMIMSMQNQQNKEKKKDLHRIHHQLIPASKNEEKKAKEKKPKDIKEEKEKQDDKESKKLDPSKCINSFPSADVMKMEEEFWKRIDINEVSFVGGSLGRYKGGVTAVQVSHNSRLVAIGLDAGYILLYDLVYQSKEEGIKDKGHGSPYLIRVVSNIKSSVVNLEFSYDNYTQLIATFADGTAKVYNINQHAGGLDKFKYAKKDQLAQRTIFQMEEKMFLNSSYCLSLDESSNTILGTSYKLDITTFFPSLTFTGMQHSYIFACQNGLIVKINSNKNVRNEQMKVGLFNRALGPIIAPEEQKFPKGKYPFFRPKMLPEPETKPHIDREFFSGHNSPILLLGFIEGSPNIISVDQRGYCFIWEYKKSSFTDLLNFKPTIKLKVELNYTLFIPEDSERIFPAKGEREINPKREPTASAMEKIGEFMSGINVPEIIDSSKCTIRDENTNTTQFFVPQTELPEEFGLADFIEYIFNSQNFCIKAVHQKFQAQKHSCQIIGAKMSKDRKYVVFHLLKDHFLSLKARENHEFVVFRIMGQRLNIFKVTLDFDKNSRIMYEISSEIPPFNLPYLYVVRGTYMLIVSLVTGQTLNRLNFGDLIKEHISTLHTKKEIIFDKIVSHNYKNLFLTSKKFDTVMQIKMYNSMESSEIESFRSFGQVLNGCWDAPNTQKLKEVISQPLFYAE
ncbi:unnamed protein product [Moneuplotes crassus]|uniref:Uncharacterized protein n=2 Tax=Euplotes crassus TaxID=5936 RepID=A0AAD1XDZ8_EUPCR|nr:unnamed protein product [Moneuplotes crassus]